MSNVIVDLKHQSAPKETDLSKAIREAAREIHDGSFKPALEENIFGHMEEDFWDTGITGLLAQHPRVQEVLRKLETQVCDKTSNEYIEKAEMLHELNEMASRNKHLPGQQRWQGNDNLEERLVNPLTPMQFIQKLQLAGVSAALEPVAGIENLMDDRGILRPAEVLRSEADIWIGKYTFRDAVGLFAWVDDVGVVVSRLQIPSGPEWGVVRFDEYNCPIGYRYHGWRTALLALIQKRVITEEQAHRAFGPPKINNASEFYRQQLWQFRNEVKVG